MAYRSVGILLLASGALFLPRATFAIKHRQRRTLHSGMKGALVTNLSHTPSAEISSSPSDFASASSPFLHKVLPCSLLDDFPCSIPPSLRKKDIPPEQLNFFRLVVVCIVLVIPSVLCLAASFNKVRSRTAQQKAENELQEALRNICSQPVSKKSGQPQIYAEQMDSELQQKFNQAQAHRPLDTAIVRHADLEHIKQTAAKAGRTARRGRAVRLGKITWSARTTTDDYMAFAALHQGKQAAGLSYADGCRPGGGFRLGRGAVEESFCCGSFYYPSLKEAHDSLHTAPEGTEQNHFGFPDVRSSNGKIQVRKTDRARPKGEEGLELDWKDWNPAQEFKEYATVLVSHNVRRYRVLDVDAWKLLERDDQHYVTFVSAAAPRWAARTGGSSGVLTNASEEESDMLFSGKGPDGHPIFGGVQPLRDAIESILFAPKLIKPDLQILVLGPWGTGPLRGNFEKSIHYFLRVIVETDALYLYEEIHFTFFGNQRVDTLQDLLVRGLQSLDNPPAVTPERVNEPIACFHGFVPSTPSADAA